MPEILAVTIPQETVNDETVRILSWMVASGSHVEKEQLLCEVETSKAVLEIHAPDAGIVRYVAAVGDEVPVGATICEVFPRGVGAPAEPALAAKTVQDATASSAAELPPARFTASARAMATDRGIDLASFPPGALVRSADVLRKAGEGVPSRSTPGAREARRANTPSENTPVPGVPVIWHDLPRRKLLESDILRTAQSGCIQSSVTVICRSSAFRARVEALGLSTRTALVIFEAARLLRKYPMFNAVCQSGRMGQY
jgi:pyruvate/2-oxoglutarate dehydrogenase complex dihydrolipoamide acyltransferase (E2) component